MDGSEISIAPYHQMKYVEIICLRIEGVYRNISLRIDLSFKRVGESTQGIKIQLSHLMEYWLGVSIALYHRMKYIKIIPSKIEVVYQNISLHK